MRALTREAMEAIGKVLVDHDEKIYEGGFEVVRMFNVIESRIETRNRLDKDAGETLDRRLSNIERMLERLLGNGSGGHA